jgi:hypothetical protein
MSTLSPIPEETPMPEIDYSSLIGKTVRIPTKQRRDVIRGRLESCRPVGPGCILAVIRRRSGAVAFVGGRFALEAVRRG